jgi:hypothetical protein
MWRVLGEEKCIWDFSEETPKEKHHLQDLAIDGK